MAEEFDPIEATSVNASGLVYDATADLYIFHWATARAWSKTCRMLTVTLADGTRHIAYFSFS